MQDIVLVTVDCFRDDATDQMPRIQSLQADGEFTRTSMVTHAPNTVGSLPGLLTSGFYTDTWNSSGEMRPGVVSLPEVLDRAGYETAGFVAGNPWAGRFSETFDTFWNGDTGGVSGETALQRAVRLSTLEPQYRAEEVLDRADDWWEETAGPRFLWVHLMDLHGPLLPGLKRGVRTGPLRTLVAAYLRARYVGRDHPDWVVDQVKRLYRTVASRLDERLEPWVEGKASQSTVFLTGDHGEEFDHGVVGHKRLYDEVVKVPFLTNADVPVSSTRCVRQFDFAPTVTDVVGVDSPEVWRGVPFDAQGRPQLLLAGPNTNLGRIWGGVRTEETKFIRTYDLDFEPVDAEAYDLEADPDEENGIPVEHVPERLRESVTELIESDEVRETLADWHPGVSLSTDESVQQRLEDLGYVG